MNLTGHSGAVTCVVFSPDGKLVASGSDDHTIKLWNVSNGLEVLTLFDHYEAVTCLTFNPDGDILDTEEMPWDYYTRMTDDELSAIWLYIESLE